MLGLVEAAAFFRGSMIQDSKSIFEQRSKKGKLQ